MMAIEGRVALRLDEFMLRLGHLTILAHLASSSAGRPRRLEKDFAEFLTRPTVVEEGMNEPVAAYLSAKRLCPDAGKPAADDRRDSNYRYPDLETHGGHVRAVNGSRVEIWWQDYCL